MTFSAVGPWCKSVVDSQQFLLQTFHISGLQVQIGEGKKEGLVGFYEMKETKLSSYHWDFLGWC